MTMELRKQNAQLSYNLTSFPCPWFVSKLVEMQTKSLYRSRFFFKTLGGCMKLTSTRAMIYMLSLSVLVDQELHFFQ